MTTLICHDAIKCVLLNSFTLYKDDNKDFKTQRRDGNENIAEKVKLRSSSLYRNYSSQLPLSNVGEPSWSYPSAYPYPSAERETKIEVFSRGSRAKTGKKYRTKRRDACAKLLFCLLNLLFFWRSCCRPRRWIFKSLMWRQPLAGNSKPSLPVDVHRSKTSSLALPNK